MKINELKKLVREEVLKEIKTPQYSQWKSLVPKVSEACKWEYDEVMEFISELMIDCNFHREAKKVYHFMDKL